MRLVAGKESDQPDRAETIVERAQALRSQMSPPEHQLWDRLSGRQLDGLKFRRQHPFDPYMLDFYCPEVRLAVEVDGWAHAMGDQPQRDERRDAFLAERGIRTLRIPASDVAKDIEAVLITILGEARR
ncbi:MAG: endonuclease domain-containing protein [Caulobacteraceae bacterium]